MGEDLDHLLENNLEKLTKRFPHFKRLGAFDRNRYSFEFLPEEICGAYSLSENKITINPFSKNWKKDYQLELSDTIIHEEAHFIQKKLYPSISNDYELPHSFCWFGLYKLLGGELGGFYKNIGDKADTFVSFAALTHYLAIFNYIQNRLDKSGTGKSEGFKPLIMRFTDGMTIIDFSNFYGLRKLLPILALQHSSFPILAFYQEGFKLIQKGKIFDAEPVYDLHNLKFGMRYK